MLKPQGFLIVSEITWLTRERPAEINRYWQEAYPEVGLASEKMAALETAGYQIRGYFPLPEDCWLTHYYQPLHNRLEEFLDRHGHSAMAQAIVAATHTEIEMYQRYKAYFSYGMYIAQKWEMPNTPACDD